MDINYDALKDDELAYDLIVYRIPRNVHVHDNYFEEYKAKYFGFRLKKEYSYKLIRTY